MRRGVFISICVALAALFGAIVVVGDLFKDKDDGGYAGSLYWEWRRAPSGLTEPLFRVRVNGRYGFINATGQIVIEPRFERLGYFHEGLCAAYENGLEGYIDPTGAWVIQPRFKMAGNFHEGRAPVRKTYEDGYGYIDRTGTLVIEYQYDSASPFVDGVARVGHATVLSSLKGKIADVGVTCWYEYIDLAGNRVTKPAMNHPPKEAAPGPLFPFRSEGRMGYKDASGRVVVEPIYDRTDPFEDGLGGVGTHRGMKNGYVDATGKVVWEPSS